MQGCFFIFLSPKYMKKRAGWSPARFFMRSQQPPLPGIRKGRHFAGCVRRRSGGLFSGAAQPAGGLSPPFSDFLLADGFRRDCAASAAQFLSSLHLHLFCVLHFTASCLCPFLLFTKRRKPQRGKEGKGWRNLKVFCAPPDARPLIPAVPKAWQSL